MNADLGMAMMYPFPIFSNAALTTINKKESEQSSIENNNVVDLPPVELEFEQETISSNMITKSPLVQELLTNLSLHDAMLEIIQIQKLQWDQLKERAQKLRRCDSGVCLSDKFEETDEIENYSDGIFRNATTILNRIASRLNSDELKAVFQSSLIKLLQDIIKLKTIQENKEPNLSIQIQDDFSSLFDEIQPQRGLLFRLADRQLNYIFSWGVYFQTIIGNFSESFENFTKSVIPDQISSLLRPILIYMISIVLIALLSQPTLRTNWNRICADTNSLLNILRFR